MSAAVELPQPVRHYNVAATTRKHYVYHPPCAPTYSPHLSDLIATIPYRMAFAGGWIDQPFVPGSIPRPPGSMVVVGLEPTFRFMERAGMATGTRNVAVKLWNGGLPDARPGGAGPRAVCRGEPRPGRAVRLAGHDRADLSGREPPGLRLPPRRRHFPRPHRVLQRSGGRPLAGSR